MNAVEIKTTLEKVERVYAKDGAHFYLSCAYGGNLYYELDGKKYKVIVQEDDPDIQKNRILLDIYPYLMRYYETERAPRYLFKSVKAAQRTNVDMDLSMQPQSVEEVEGEKASLYLTAPHFCITATVQAEYSYTYKGELIKVNYSEKLRFLAVEIQ
ncbi:MAG: hypothetical protein NC302_03780 [Bacteroidales bacterium]|nr:hypothetical protein [Bacteroidales bacterium]MCM1414598.1 hypothetical protein [bacterium]MCM1423853.1 hypothetical protein [bacterium]